MNEPGDRPSYPVETIRHWYVTPFGGTSEELTISQVGINARALEANTSLDPAMDRVRVAFVGRARARPLLLDRFYEIVPLDERHPDALALSPRGEAVLYSGDDLLRRYEAPRPGEEVLLNSVLSARMGFIGSPEDFERILCELLRKKDGVNQDNA